MAGRETIMQELLIPDATKDREPDVAVAQEILQRVHDCGV
jgi:hypothetical protein